MCLTRSMEAKLPTHYNERTSGSSHSNLDPMKVIIQELQLMRTNMKKMRGNITNLSMEHRDQRNIGGHVTSPTQWRYGNRLGTENGYNNKSDYNCENRRRMGFKQIKAWSLIKQALRIKCGVVNHDGQRQGQAKEKFMESLMDEKSTKVDELSKAQDVVDRKFFNFLTTTCGTKSNYGMKAKEKGMGKELSIGYEDTSISFSLNPFLLRHELSFKELKLCLELNASYVTLVGNFMANSFTCEQDLDVARMLKSSSSCAYVEK
ncbi:hypothetical protein M9H77_02737 [Catharanthus roseus]|uniref:Uncharacterized protein n=1 Tax=Catharanthus roseus TaxID=4058 RepID=A0ACC0C9N6_CATRO|nr:hypothetical protein M9H77_02737 [Catharanthus roseus]